MPKLQLTDRACAAAKPGTDYFDSVIRGLNLRTTPNGIRSWYLVYTSPKDGKRARIRLGGYPECELAKVRALAVELKASIEDGNDPRTPIATAASGPMTVADLVAN